jgi:hypothetical protein
MRYEDDDEIIICDVNSINAHVVIYYCECVSVSVCVVAIIATNSKLYFTYVCCYHYLLTHTILLN